MSSSLVALDVNINTSGRDAYCSSQRQWVSGAGRSAGRASKPTPCRSGPYVIWILLGRCAAAACRWLGRRSEPSRCLSYSTLRDPVPRQAFAQPVSARSARLAQLYCSAVLVFAMRVSCVCSLIVTRWLATFSRRYLERRSINDVIRRQVNRISSLGRCTIEAARRVTVLVACNATADDGAVDDWWLISALHRVRLSVTTFLE